MKKDIEKRLYLFLLRYSYVFQLYSQLPLRLFRQRLMLYLPKAIRIRFRELLLLQKTATVV